MVDVALNGNAGAPRMNALRESAQDLVENGLTGLVARRALGAVGLITWTVRSVARLGDQSDLGGLAGNLAGQRSGNQTVTLEFGEVVVEVKQGFEGDGDHQVGLAALLGGQGAGRRAEDELQQLSARRC